MIAQCLLFVFILHHFWLISAMSYWNIRELLPTWNLKWNHHFYCYVSRMTVRSLLFKYRQHTHTHRGVSSSCWPQQFTLSLLYSGTSALTSVAPAPRHNKNTPAPSRQVSAIQQAAKTVIRADPWNSWMFILSDCPLGGSSQPPSHKTMLPSPGVKPLIGQNIQGSRATSGEGAESRGELGTSPGLPPGTLSRRCNQEGKKNDPAEGEEATARAWQRGQSSKPESYAAFVQVWLFFFCLSRISSWQL